MLMLELNPPDNKLLNIKLQDFGRFLMNLEYNTRLVSVRETSEALLLMFYNENYISGDFKLEIKEELGKMLHNEASFFKPGYTPVYNEPVTQEEDYDSSY